MHLAYEHFRIRPSDDVAKKITDSFLENFIADTNHTETKKLEEMKTNATDYFMKMYSAKILIPIETEIYDQ